MNDKRYDKLYEMISQSIIELELLIRNNCYKEHDKRYNKLLTYLKDYKQKVTENYDFESEIDDIGLNLGNYLNGSIDPKEFYESILLIDDYFFNEFLMI